MRVIFCGAPNYFNPNPVVTAFGLKKKMGGELDREWEQTANDQMHYRNDCEHCGGKLADKHRFRTCFICCPIIEACPWCFNPPHFGLEIEDPRVCLDHSGGNDRACAILRNETLDLPQKLSRISKMNGQDFCDRMLKVHDYHEEIQNLTKAATNKMYEEMRLKDMRTHAC